VAANRSSHEAAPNRERQGQLHEQPIGELLKQLSAETTTLVRQELDLVKAEMREKGRKAGPGFGLIGAAGAVTLLGLGALTAFFILGLDGFVPNWLAALIVAVVYGAVAALLYVRGKDKVEDAGSPVPRQTIETIREDVQWAKHPTTSAKR
jgi:Putative Actinobacterial Holin-X, holin superfamily III